MRKLNSGNMGRMLVHLMVGKLFDDVQGWHNEDHVQVIGALLHKVGVLMGVDLWFITERYIESGYEPPDLIEMRSAIVNHAINHMGIDEAVTWAFAASITLWHIMINVDGVDEPTLAEIRAIHNAIVRRYTTNLLETTYAYLIWELIDYTDTMQVEIAMQIIEDAGLADNATRTMRSQ